MEKRQAKPTNGQLQRRLQNAIIHIDKTKDTKTVFFDDKGLRLTVNDEYAIIATGYHKHIFDAYNMAQGISRPYLYTKRVVEIALENDCISEGGYSYKKLLETLETKEDNAEYNIVKFAEFYFQNIFAPLYLVGETNVEAFLVYEDYIHNIARQSVLLSEKTKDMTNKQFLKEINKNINSFVKELDEFVLFKKKTDEEVMRENFDAEINRLQENGE